jgi:hypothetical protein
VAVTGILSQIPQKAEVLAFNAGLREHWPRYILRAMEMPYGRGAIWANIGAQLVFGAAATLVSAAAVAEALNAFGLIDNGSAPGADYRFRVPLVMGAVCALLVTAFSSPVIALSRRLAQAATTPATFVFIVAAAGLCVTRFYAYDSYYAPSRIRFGGSDSFSPSFVVLAVVLDLVAAGLLFRWPRLALCVFFPALITSAFYVFAAGLGH